MMTMWITWKKNLLQNVPQDMTAVKFDEWVALDQYLQTCMELSEGDICKNILSARLTTAENDESSE